MNLAQFVERMNKAYAETGKYVGCQLAYGRCVYYKAAKIGKDGCVWMQTPRGKWFCQTEPTIQFFSSVLAANGY